MQKVLNALKCVNCQKIVSLPVTLPCGHMVCQSHTQTTENQIACLKCGSLHVNTGFVVSEAMSQLIAAQLDSINLGEQHTRSVKSCEELRKRLDENKNVLNNLDYFIYESIDEIKKELLFKSEQLKLRIDQVIEELIDDLEKYYSRCKENSSSQEFRHELNKFIGLNCVAMEKCDEWSRELNQLKTDEEIRKRIELESNAARSNIEQDLEIFKEALFLGELEQQKIKSEYFDRIDIFSALNTNEPRKWLKIVHIPEFDSLIIDKTLKRQLFSLCSSILMGKTLNLLYRGSRDGFEALNYHEKCDYKKNTLTIVRTTQGSVLGGYTSVAFGSLNPVCKDSEMFVFSLVNPHNQPFSSKLIEPFNVAIHDKFCGPIFGNGVNHALFISNKSNTQHGKSYAVLDKNTCKLPILTESLDGRDYFCNTRYFQVQEIEVFKIEINT